MTSATWHVSPELIARYETRALDFAVEASVERHLAACAACRADVARLAAPATQVEQVWTGVREAIAAPTEPWLVRHLRRLGLKDTDAVLLSASQALHVPWVLAVAAALVFSALSAMNDGARAGVLFLTMAPLVPALGVVASYDSTDPIRDIVDVTPRSKIRLGLLRVAAVAAASVPTVFLAGLAIPGIGTRAFVWLLPALALTLAALVLLTWFSSRATATAVAVSWLATVVAIEHRGTALVTAATVPFLLISIALAVAAALTLVLLSPTRLPGGHR
jgi:hypothetical protein